MGALWTLALKDLRLLLRDRFALFWILAFPFAFALFFGAIFSDSGGGGGSPMPIAIVDDDGSEGSASFVEALADHASLAVARDDGGRPLTATLDEAREAVRKGRRVAYLRVPAGFGARPFALFGAGDGDGGGLELGLDPGRAAEGGMLQGVLMETLFTGLTRRFGDKQLMRAELSRSLAELQAPGADGDAGLAPIQRAVLATFLRAADSFFADVDADVLADGPTGGLDSAQLLSITEVTRDRTGVPRSAYDITLPSGMLWGLMSIAMSFAVMIVRERSEGTWLRLSVAPLSRGQLLAGKGLACFLTCLAVMALLLLFGVAALGVRVGSPALLVLALLSTAACFTGLMMVSSVLGSTEQAVAGTSWGLMMPLAMIGGGMIPLAAMPPWLLTASHFSPFKWGIYALEGAVWRGFTATDMLLPCAILVGTGAAAFATGVAVMKRRDAGT